MNDEDINGLAAEYVLGSLTHDERGAVKARLKSDAQLAAAVAGWERRLLPWSQREPGLPPPPGILESILARIAEQQVGETNAGAVVALRRRVRQWQLLSGGLAATAAALVIILAGSFLTSNRPASGPMVAVLTQGAMNPAADEATVSTSPIFVATVERGSQKLSIRQIKGRRAPSGKNYALWILEANRGQPAFLGNIPSDWSTASFELARRSMDDVMATGFVVSMENMGETGKIRGPIISEGKLVQISK